MIVIIDYGMGNLHSVENALQHIGATCKISQKAEDIYEADGLILPGVGAFPDCMENLAKLQLIAPIKAMCAKGIPLLGICLGMQVLFEAGFEGEGAKGLGLLQGKVALMEDEALKIPHIGWNRLERNHQDPLFDTFEVLPFVYYVHSYRIIDYNDADLIAYSMYGEIKIPGYFRHQNIMGMQYHPEKSGRDGLQMLTLFKEMCK